MAFREVFRTLPNICHGSSEATLHRCSQEKVFWKYVANLQKNTHVEVWFQSLAMKKTWYTEAYIWLLESVARSCPIKKMFLTQVFSSEFAKFLRTPFFIQQFSFIEHLRCLLLVVNYFQKNFQKQPSRDVHKKRCYENMQQIYRRTPMPKKKATFIHLIKALNS